MNRKRVESVRNTVQSSLRELDDAQGFLAAELDADHVTVRALGGARVILDGVLHDLGDMLDSE